MSKYEVIRLIMENNKLNEDEKVNFIKYFLGGWLTEEELKWIWEI